MNKISIIGCPGSGKSHFSVELQALTGLPLFHLDKIYHSLEFGLDRDANREFWVHQLRKIIDRSNWITDGNYFSTQYARLKYSDTIIIFDYSRRVIYWRLLKRRIKFRKVQRPDMPSGWQEKLSRSFIKSHVIGFRKKFEAVTRPELSALPQTVRVVVFKKPKDAQNYLKKLTGK